MLRLIAFVAVIAVGVGLSTSGQAASLTPAAASGNSIVLRVMTYNMAGGEWGWQYGPGSPQTTADEQGAVDAIRAARADVVGIQEPFGRTRLIAKMLGPGWYAYPRLHTVSRYPILEPGGADHVYGYLQVAPGKVVALLNTHLPSTPYGPYGVRDGKSKALVLHNEALQRIPWMQPILAAARPLIASGTPTILTGDFNSPSWRDWTPAVVKARGFTYSVNWPVSREIEAAGFHDSFRTVHPDPLAKPGITWPSGWPTFQHSAKWADRIDFVWTGGPITALASQVVGYPTSPYTDIPVSDWTSDHRAVVSTLRIRPVAPPPLVAVDSARVTKGAGIGVTFRAPAKAGVTVELERGGSVVASRSTSATQNGHVQFSSSSLAPGIYSVALGGLGSSAPAPTTVTVVAAGAQPTIAVAKAVYAVGEPIRVSWRNDPGNRYDWLSVNPAKGTPLTDDLLEWQYVNAAVNGKGQIGVKANGTWPLKAGSYKVWLCLDDGYVCWDSAAFTVR